MYANILCRVTSPDPGVPDVYHRAWKVEHHGSLCTLHLDNASDSGKYARPDGVLQVETLEFAVEIMANW